MGGLGLGEQFSVATPAWMAAIAQVATRLLSDIDLGDADFSVVEMFTDVPGHIPSNISDGFAWHICVTGAVLDVGPGPIDSPDLTVILNYSVAETLARLQLAADPANQALAQAITKAALESGQMRYIGDNAKVPPALADRLALLHDEMASRTA
jgi:hypothetical protein